MRWKSGTPSTSPAGSASIRHSPPCRTTWILLSYGRSSGLYACLASTRAICLPVSERVTPSSSRSPLRSTRTCGGSVRIVVTSDGFQVPRVFEAKYLRAVSYAGSSLVVASRKPSTISRGCSPARGATPYTRTCESASARGEPLTGSTSPLSGIEAQPASSSPLTTSAAAPRPRSRRRPPKRPRRRPPGRPPRRPRRRR